MFKKGRTINFLPFFEFIQFFSYKFLNTFFDPGNRYSVPYAYTVTLIGYNVEKLKALNLPTDTWALIFEPRYLAKLKGRVTVLDS
ncbi:MAG TPA: hypothetical protein PLN45_05320, partial [Exilispira sp.]|nr:hypothetical protein [Exilispira sp.]